MDAEFGCILGQPLHATPCVVGLLPPQALRPSRHGVWAEAVLIVACSCRGNIALFGLTRFQGLALNVSAFHKYGRDRTATAARCVSIPTRMTQAGRGRRKAGIVVAPL